MPSGKIKGNVETEKVTIAKGPAKISLHNDFGGGAVTVRQYVNSRKYDLLQNGAPIVISANSDNEYKVRSGDTVFLSMDGAIDPDVDWSITSN